MISVAAAFSSESLRRLVPGMGTISSPWASTQANRFLARRVELAIAPIVSSIGTVRSAR